MAHNSPLTKRTTLFKEILSLSLFCVHTSKRKGRNVYSRARLTISLQVMGLQRVPLLECWMACHFCLQPQSESEKVFFKILSYYFRFSIINLLHTLEVSPADEDCTLGPV